MGAISGWSFTTTNCGEANTPRLIFFLFLKEIEKSESRHINNTADNWLSPNEKVSVQFSPFLTKVSNYLDVTDLAGKIAKKSSFDPWKTSFTTTDSFRVP